MAFAFEELKVYQKALNFANSVIDVIENLETPGKHFKLIDQLESACTSISMNIAEGKGRHSKKEFSYFLYVSRGSLFETITLLRIFCIRQWIDNDTYSSLYHDAEEISKMISGLINKL